MDAGIRLGWGWGGEEGWKGGGVPCESRRKGGGDVDDRRKRMMYDYYNSSVYAHVSGFVLLPLSLINSYL